MQILCDADEDHRVTPMPIVAAALDGVVTLIELAAFALARKDARDDARARHRAAPRAPVALPAGAIGGVRFTGRESHTRTLRAKLPPCVGYCARGRTNILRAPSTHVYERP